MTEPAFLGGVTAPQTDPALLLRLQSVATRRLSPEDCRGQLRSWLRGQTDATDAQIEEYLKEMGR